ncbi:Kelch repeat-containing protein [Madurella fahalii]|uniref:Kelch repeat-containing protein n=1 Tax=Madurella fahalii TaxID=1157608 RepID=A0ABQ0GFZ7_9PEZI
MLGSGLSTPALVTAFASLALGQAVWQENQVDTRICQWGQLRAHVIRDTVYLDGGSLWWQPGFSDGTRGGAVNDDNLLGLIYMLNFTTPFDITQNISAVLQTLTKAGEGPAANIAPNYVDGALLGNHEGLYLYGGLMQKSNAYDDVLSDSVLYYQRYQYGPPRDNFMDGFVLRQLPPNVTQYIAYGGAASAPSENMAWYFSGMRSSSGGPIYDIATASDTELAVNLSRTLVSLNMESQQNEIFSASPLPSSIPGRANPELVWVPVGPRGILVALGGVVFPDFAYPTMVSPDEEASRMQSPSFMTTIDIYDVASDSWYRQRTTDGPGQLTRGCAVVAPAQDSSSFNIYYYGGYDGLHQMERFSDDVWVLSLPSFTWVKLASGDGEGRAGHKCVMPYPDQMLVIGGYPPLAGSPLRCLKEPIRVFNLSTGAWRDRYDPAVFSNYTVPSVVREVIGGSETGDASVTTPIPSGWDSDELASIFATPYPTSRIMTYYPYASITPPNNTNPNATPSPVPHEGGGIPAYLPPVLGTVLGLVFVTVVAVLILLWRRRRLLRPTPSEAGTEDTNGNRIASWLRGQTSPPKAMTVASSEITPLTNTDVESVGVPPRSVAEIMSREVAELPGNSYPAELHDTPMTHIKDTTRFSHLSESPAIGRGSVNNGSYYSNGTQQVDHASTVSSSTPQPPPVPPNASPVYYRPDSDALGDAPMTSATTSPTTTTTASPDTARGNVLSGISNLSERDRTHLRQISDTTVSSVTTAPGVDRVLVGGPAGAREGFVDSPAVVSPPTMGPAEGADYLSARGQGSSGESPLRRSVFTERNEDMNGGNDAEKTG